MYYHLSDYVYIAQFRDEFILLNTKEDKYTIYLKPFSKLLADIFGKNTSHLEDNFSPTFDSENPAQDLGFIQKLLDNNIIKEKDFPYPYYIDKKSISKGVSNVDWRLPLENKKISLNIRILKALATLIKVNFYIKTRGLYPTIQLIKQSRKNESSYIIPEDADLRDLANVVNKACLLYPTRTKCLEWAMTFVLLALKRKWKCNLEIGVQNYPFMAHAWVECDGKVVMDSQELREGLAIILNEPFRRIRV